MLLNRVEKTVLLIDGDTHHKIHKVGPSLWGNIYRSENNEGFFRIIPIDQANLEHRQLIRRLKNVEDNWTIPIAGSGLCQLVINNIPLEAYYIFYKTNSPTAWAHIIENPDLQVRIEYASKILSRFHIWRELVNNNPLQYILPMPADIVIVNEDPYLLYMPFWGQPSFEACMEETTRIFYFPPEFLLGKSEQIVGSNIDIYALGVSFFQCLYRIDHTMNLEQLFLEISTGSFFFTQEMRERFSFWMPRTEVFRNLISEIKSLVDRDVKVRGSIKAGLLANRLANYKQNMDPVCIIAFMVDRGNYLDSFNLIRDILLEVSSYEMLVMAGSLAQNNLGRTLEAIDFYERAIASDKERVDAYERQLSAITEPNLNIRPEFLKDLVGFTLRNFARLPDDRKRNNEVNTARYLIGQKAYKEAGKIIYDSLFEKNCYLWWKFEMRVLYNEYLIRIGKTEEAKEAIKELKRNIENSARNPSFKQNEIASGLRMVDELEKSFGEILN